MMLIKVEMLRHDLIQDKVKLIVFSDEFDE